MSLEQENVTSPIIAAAIEVHRALGPGFVESVYQAALAVELRARGIPHRRELLVPVRYRGVEVGRHRLDLLVAGEIVVELKAIRELSDAHFAIVRSYLRATGFEHGLILNFAGRTLEVRRVFGTPDASRRPEGAPATG